MSGRDLLLRSLSAELVEALEVLVDERVNEALGQVENGATSPWLSIAQASVYLGLSERKIHALVKSNRIKSTTIGRRRLLNRDDLDAFARSATGEETAPTVPPRRRGG